MNTPKRLYGPAQLGVGDATLWTVAADTVDIITSILLVNPTVGPQTARIGIGGTADGQLIHSDMTVPAHGEVFVEISVPIDETESIHASASAVSALTLTISGIRRA